MKAYRLIYLILAAAALLMGCIDDRYPTIYEEVPEDENVINGEGESRDIPILITFSDPTYSVITRGTGIFDDYFLDSLHWAMSYFHTFAMLTGSEADYEHTSAPHCLLYDQTTLLVDGQGNTKFCLDPAHLDEHVERFYLRDQRTTPYKFFTFHCDSLAYTLQPTTRSLKARLTLDGTSDLIHSFAYHTDSLLQTALRSIGTDSEAEELRIGGQSLLYSTLAGSRDINPVFYLNHLLCRFDFRIQGVETAEGDAPFLNILFDRLAIQAPRVVTITVADDSWTEQTYKQALAAPHPLLDYHGTGIYLPTIDYNNDISTTAYSQAHAPGCDYTAIGRQWAALFPTSEYPFYRLGDTTGRPLLTPNQRGVPMAWLLPPQDNYEVTLSGRRINIAPDGRSLMRVEDQYYHSITSTSTLALRDDEGRPVPFRAGHQYTITIYVYGDGHISATVTGIDRDQWTDENPDNPFVIDNDQDHKI